jgi:hypothetical protein
MTWAVAAVIEMAVTRYWANENKPSGKNLLL